MYGTNTGVNTLRPRQNGRHFADAIFKRIFLNENILIPIKIPLKFVPKGSINNISALVQIMAWRRPGDTPLSEPMMVNSPTHICVIRPQWVNGVRWPRVKIPITNGMRLLQGVPVCDLIISDHLAYDMARHFIIHKYWLDRMSQCSRWHHPISKICRFLLMDEKIWMISLIIMFALGPICVQDSVFKMYSLSLVRVLNPISGFWLCAEKHPVTWASPQKRGDFEFVNLWLFLCHFLSSGTKMLSKPMLTSIYKIIWHH